jgi:transcription-repair coupling factor (superfamily II helicase)
MPTATVSERCKLTGVCPPARGAVLAELIRSGPSAVWLVIVDDVLEAEGLAEDAAFFHAASGQKRARGASESADFLVFPESITDSGELREAFTASSDRLNELNPRPPPNRGSASSAQSRRPWS